jgi:hypothetical protein
MALSSGAAPANVPDEDGVVDAMPPDSLTTEMTGRASEKQ